MVQANKRKEPEEIFEEAAKLAEQTQPAVTVAPVAKEAPVDTRRKNKLDQTKNVTIMITKKMVLENNKRIEVVRIK